MRQFAISNGQDKRFNAFLDTVAILPDCPGRRTAQKNRYIRNTKNMQHFLQPRFLGNMLRKMLAYRLSKLACGGGSVYQGKTVHTTSTMSAHFQTKERYSNAVNA